jgi:cytidylate kinase
MINILTMEREYGSGAAVIAERVAARLGWKLWDQSLTDEIARFLECPRHHVEQREERRDPLHYRLLKSFLRGSFEGNLNLPRMKLADAEGIRKTTEQMIRKIASQGDAVIVGRGSAYYLRDREDAFHVFVYAPFEEKVRRLQGEGKSQEEAMDLVENVDQERTAFIKQHFGIEWPSRQFFHLMVNSTVGEDMAVEIVLSGLAAAQKSLAHATDGGIEKR